MGGGGGGGGGGVQANPLSRSVTALQNLSQGVNI